MVPVAVGQGCWHGYHDGLRAVSPGVHQPDGVCATQLHTQVGVLLPPRPQTEQRPCGRLLLRTSQQASVNCCFCFLPPCRTEVRCMGRFLGCRRVFSVRKREVLIIKQRSVLNPFRPFMALVMKNFANLGYL